MAWTLAASAIGAMVAGGVFVRIGWRLRQAETRRPLRHFAIWWMAIGAATLSYAARVAAALVGQWGMVVAIQALSIALTGLAMWGLVAYLSYIYVGSHRGGRIAAWVYAALVGATLAFIVMTGPQEVRIHAWTVDATGGAGRMDLLLTLAFLVPPIAAGLLMLPLWRHATGREQRRRILAVGLGIPAWVFVHLAARISDADGWQFFTRVVLGVAVATAIAWAYGVGPRPRGDAAAMQERLAALV